MSSMIVSTKPDRRILEASPELAETVGAEPKRMCGLDCARAVQCRNAEGKPLCGEFCPALAAARGASGLAQEVPVWLRNPAGALREFTATFQRIGNLPNGMVVALFEGGGGSSRTRPYELRHARLRGHTLPATAVLSSSASSSNRDSRSSKISCTETIRSHR